MDSLCTHLQSHGTIQGTGKSLAWFCEKQIAVSQTSFVSKVK